MQRIQDLAHDYLMDTTVRTYQENFGRYRDSTRSNMTDNLRGWLDMFATHLPPNGTILEIGSATGRDARYFTAKGFAVTCTDVIPQALEELARDGFVTAAYDFRDEPKPQWLGAYDGFFANAVLLHASDDTLERALKNSALILKRGGVAGWSFRTGTGDSVSTGKMGAPRYFKYQSEATIRAMLAPLPFDVLDVSLLDDSMLGTGAWLHVIARRR